jgi:hypothetical protein
MHTCRARHPSFRPHAIAIAAALALVACGGGDSNTASTAPASGTTVSAAATFPSGMAVGSPGELASSATLLSAAPPDGLRLAVDFTRAAWAAISQRDARTLGRLAAALLPLGQAHASTVALPGIKADAVLMDRLLSGDTSVTPASVLSLEGLLGGSENASCYGPGIAYASHQDATPPMPASGSLPGGDLGLWKATEGATQPCVIAQLNARVAGVKGRSRQGLLLMAVMRLAVARSGLAMPAPGASVDLVAPLETALAAVPEFSIVDVAAATLALGAGGTYTYRLVLTLGSGASAKTGEIILRHTPGASDTVYSGVMQVAGFRLSSDAAFGCTDEMDASTGRFKVAQVSTLKYSRDGNAIAFGSRDGLYCGHAASTGSADHGAEVASLTADGQLNPAVKIAGTTRAASTGWRGSFTRFAGSYDKDTVAGNFLSAWQAGTGDGKSRAMAAHADYNSATEARSLNGYFAFADDVGSSDGSLLGMVCNWAGPGNDHAPVLRFQSQSATLSASATEYALGASKITYAPTRSCSSTTTAYDADASGSIGSSEGVGVVADLDAPGGTSTVQQEIEARAFSKPGLF